MEITRRADYAIRMLLALAAQPDGSIVSSRDLGARQDVPPAFARSILTDLVSAGLVTSRRGKGGGISLARSPAKISVLDILRATDGKPCLNLCTSDPDYCRRAESCAMHAVWHDAEDLLSDYLGSITLQALVDRSTTPGGEPLDAYAAQATATGLPRR